MADSFWRWPGPAVLAWGVGWIAMTLASLVGAPPPWALLIGVLPAIWWRRRAAPGWRRLLVLAGLPLSVLLVQGTAAVPAWTWLVAGAGLLLLYPIQAWRDAPLFPTPRGALTGLPAVAALEPEARVLDAGSGLGDGLIALRRVYPQAELHGVEGGWALCALSRVRLRWAHLKDAHVERGDFWRTDWAPFDLVYLFQRPESMGRAWVKAQREMRVGRWLVSLEFDVPGVTPEARLEAADGRPVWVYRISGPAGFNPGVRGPITSEPARKRQA